MMGARHLSIRVITSTKITYPSKSPYRQGRLPALQAPLLRRDCSPLVLPYASSSSASPPFDGQPLPSDWQVFCDDAVLAGACAVLLASRLGNAVIVARSLAETVLEAWAVSSAQAIRSSKKDISPKDLLTISKM